MKKLLKSIFKIVIRFITFIIITVIILFILDKIIKINLESSENSITENKKYDKDYYKPMTDIINIINSGKIQTDFWNYNANDYSIVTKGNTIPKKTDKKRILVVGDSFVWGWAQDNYNNLFWRQLEYIFKKNGYQDVEIIAAGMNGFSIVDEVEKIILDDKYINRVNPDLIVMGYVYNDFEIWDRNDSLYSEEIDADFSEKNYIKKYINKGLVKKIENIFPNIHKKLTQLLMKKEYAKESFKKKYGYSREELMKLHITDKNLKRIENKAIIPLSKVKKPVVVVNLPFDPYLYGDKSIDFQEKVFSLLDKYNITNYDLKEAYNKEFKNVDYKTELQVNYDYHPNARLMNFYAREIYDIINRDYKNILGQRKEKFVNKDFKIIDTFPVINLQNVGNNTYSFFHEKFALRMYYKEDNRPFTKLNLEYPTEIKKITIKTENIYDIYVTVDYYNESLGYEDEKYIKANVEQLDDNLYIVKIPKNKKVTSINISADTTNGLSIGKIMITKE